MIFDSLLDTSRGFGATLFSIFSIVLLSLIYKLFSFIIDNSYKKQQKRELDMRRAFKALKLLAGDKWPSIREEIMKEEKFN